MATNTRSPRPGQGIYQAQKEAHAQGKPMPGNAPGRVGYLQWMMDGAAMEVSQALTDVWDVSEETSTYVSHYVPLMLAKNALLDDPDNTELQQQVAQMQADMPPAPQAEGVMENMAQWATEFVQGSWEVYEQGADTILAAGAIGGAAGATVFGVGGVVGGGVGASMGYAAESVQVTYAMTRAEEFDRIMQMQTNEDEPIPREVALHYASEIAFYTAGAEGVVAAATLGMGGPASSWLAKGLKGPMRDYLMKRLGPEIAEKVIKESTETLVEAGIEGTGKGAAGVVNQRIEREMVDEENIRVTEEKQAELERHSGLIFLDEAGRGAADSTGGRYFGINSYADGAARKAGSHVPTKGGKATSQKPSGAGTDGATGAPDGHGSLETTTDATIGVTTDVTGATDAVNGDTAGTTPAATKPSDSATVAEPSASDTKNTPTAAGKDEGTQTKGDTEAHDTEHTTVTGESEVQAPQAEGESHPDGTQHTEQTSVTGESEVQAQPNGESEGNRATEHSDEASQPIKPSETNAPKGPEGLEGSEGPERAEQPAPTEPQQAPAEQSSTALPPALLSQDASRQLQSIQRLVNSARAHPVGRHGAVHLAEQFKGLEVDIDADAFVAAAQAPGIAAPDAKPFVRKASMAPTVTMGMDDVLRLGMQGVDFSGAVGAAQPPRLRVQRARPETVRQLPRRLLVHGG